MRVMLSIVFVLLPVLGFAQVKRTNPPALSTPTGYTHIVEVTGPAKTVYISGQIAYDKDGKVVGAGDMKAQAEQVFKNLQTALTAAGVTFSDVVKMNTYITDMDKAPAVREVRALLRRNDTGEHTRAGGPLARPELMLEVEVIAVVAAR
jgi:enamine deaminase RidA (YjgF/YER057c/UK114 family)